jgi:valyl-tRNA synthetase
MGMSPGSDRLGRKGLFEVSLGDSSITDHWVFRQLDKARAKIDKLLGEFRFAEAYDVLYHTVWDDVADWYVESSKIEETNTLQFVLEYVLKLAHPFAPFVTETIWQSLLSVDKSTTLLISQQWPKKLKFSAWAAADFDKIINIVREIRKANIELGGGQRSLQTNNKFVLEQADLVKHLAKVSAVETGQSGLKLDSTDFELYLSASDAEIGRFSDNRATAEAAKAAKIKVLEARLANKSYVERAPTELVAETRAELAKLKKT